MGYTRHWTCRLSSGLLLRDSLVQDPPSRAGGGHRVPPAGPHPFPGNPWEGHARLPEAGRSTVRTGGADQVLTRDTEWATGAQGRLGGPGLYRALSKLGDAQGRKLAEAGQA